jgi:hypothetical protein
LEALLAADAVESTALDAAPLAVPVKELAAPVVVSTTLLRTLSNRELLLIARRRRRMTIDLLIV